MKKIIVIAVLCGIFLLTGCTDNTKLKSVKIENTTFNLVSDNNTGIIYIENYTYKGHLVYTPYYSKNGKLCRYDNGKIVEVGNDTDK